MAYLMLLNMVAVVIIKMQARDSIKLNEQGQEQWRKQINLEDTVL